ncbi:toll-like receptor 13 [Pleurodeles waltl]|uniref:toll-like receptor 13 n=1 Tax=Pleurodeles waltl TaxID=8319 RepID=UPI003709878E
MISLFIILVLLSITAQRVGCFSLQGCQVQGVWGPDMKVLCYLVGLSRVPRSLPAMVVNLDLSQNRFSNLQENDFQNLSQLQVLNVSQNEISTIESRTFSNQGRLELLNLTSNRLIGISNSMFTGLNNLTTLMLSHNNITTIELHAFSSMKHIRIIDLASNKLQTLDSMHAVFVLSTLEKLHIGDNGLYNFATEDLRGTLMNLTRLDISRNPLSEINMTSNVFQSLHSLDSSYVGGGHSVKWFFKDPCFLNALKNLMLSGVNMTPSELSDLIQHLSCSSLENIQLNYLNLTDSDNLVEQVCSFQPNLKYLQLQGNNFTGLKEDVFKNCTSLIHLDLSMNNFQEVSKLTFKHLHFLQVLSLAYNKLFVVSDDIVQMPSLQMLDLSYNNIKYIFMNQSASTSKLTHLNLFCNQLTQLFSSSQFQALGGLAELHIGKNLLLEISAPFSPALVMLKLLELRKNKLTAIRKHTFINLSALQTLNLVANQIESIEAGAFDGLSHLETLLIGSNNIASPLLEKGIFNGLTSLKELQMFSNYISYTSTEKLERPPFLQLKSLKIFTLNSQGHTGLLHLPANFFEGLISVTRIHAGNLAITTLDSTTFTYTPKLKELDLSNNLLKTIDPALFKPIANLSQLHISRIDLQSLDFLFHVNFSKMFLLRAVGNQLQVINQKHIKALPSLSFLDIRQNPFTCNCDNKDFLNWSLHNLKTQVLHFYGYICAYPPGSKGKPLHQFKTTWCRVYSEFILFISTSVVTILVMACCTVYHLFRWQVAYAYYLFLAFLYDKKQKRKSDSKYTYDAFVSYNRHDEEWVMRDLLPTLEEQYHWKLCLHHRDFQPGKPILDNIVENIYASRKTICIISEQYLGSEWCSSEMQVASFRLFDERKDVLILIFLQEIPKERLSPYHRMRKLVKRKTYLRWPQKREEVQLFWHKVNMALKTLDDGGENNPILRGTIPYDL